LIVLHIDNYKLVLIIHYHYHTCLYYTIVSQCPHFRELVQVKQELARQGQELAQIKQELAYGKQMCLLSQCVVELYQCIVDHANDNNWCKVKCNNWKALTNQLNTTPGLLSSIQTLRSELGITEKQWKALISNKALRNNMEHTLTWEDLNTVRQLLPNLSDKEWEVHCTQPFLTSKHN